MRKLIPSFILGMLLLVAGSELRASSAVAASGAECTIEMADQLFCFLTVTDPNDGNCPASYTFIAPLGGGPYEWTLSGDAFFVNGFKGGSVSVIPQRSILVDGSFTISLFENGVFQCRRTFTVTAETYCI